MAIRLIQSPSQIAALVSKDNGIHKLPAKKKGSRAGSPDAKNKWMAPRSDALTARLRYPVKGVAVDLGFTHPASIITSFIVSSIIFLYQGNLLCYQ